MEISEIITYGFSFLAVYIQLFLLVTFLERKGELKETKKNPLSKYYSVAVIVPCWNEEKTIHGTIESLLALEYPKDKLEIIIVDDGSTDNTWKEIQKYSNHPQIKIFTKENGGKHTAVNFGIDQTNAELIGCLDADSFVSSHALIDIVHIFDEKKDVMAVAPALIVHKPKNILQWAQKIEYNMSVYLKKTQALLNAIHVTPGPFSIFRREVFERIGKFKKAHNTEDQEIAYRMQENHMRIEHCHTAYVYTVVPDTIPKLYKQRLRWIYGFIKNSIDYRRLILKPQYGNFSMFTIPSGIFFISAAIYLFFSAIYSIIVFIIEKVVQYQTVGFVSSGPLLQLDWFYVNTRAIVFVMVILYTFTIIAMVIGTRMAKQKLSWHIISFVIIYSFVAPFWLMKAVWNSVVSRKPSWR